MSKFNPVIGEPVLGQPNPELERISGPQKLFLLFIAVGFIGLVGLLAYLPDVATPFK
jgi:hypothetical protein